MIYNNQICGVQGYGLTETCGASFLALPSPGHGGTVGPPTGALELRFEVPALPVAA